MGYTNAERQARYRNKLKATARASLEEAVEGKRQEILGDWLYRAFDPVMNEFAAQPPRTGEAFREWFEGVLAAELEREFRAYEDVKRRQALKTSVT